MSDVENWVPITDKEQYQYPGMQQAIAYCSDIAKLPQYSPNHPHFLWDDVQLGIRNFSKDYMIKFSIGGKEEVLFYRTCPMYKGVKRYRVDGCITQSH